MARGAWQAAVRGAAEWGATERPLGRRGPRSSPCRRASVSCSRLHLFPGRGLKPLHQPDQARKGVYLLMLLPCFWSKKLFKDWGSL